MTRQRRTGHLTSGARRTTPVDAILSGMPTTDPSPLAALLGNFVLWIGIAVGAVAGYWYARFKRAWSDFRGAKAAVAGARRTAWASVTKMLRGVAVAAGVAVAGLLFVVGAAAGEERPTVPAHAPTSSAGPR